ncbi:MAG: Aspartate racemase, partial [Microgenomates group bacterium GW2011_GWC1_49_7]
HGTQPHIILRNVSVPSVMEHDALLHGRNLDKFIPVLTRAAKALEEAAADFVVLPCNTLHVHEKIIRNALTIPFVSIIDAAVFTLRKAKIKRVGLLGSRVTVDENLFKKKSKDTDFVTVHKNLQKQIDRGLDVFVGTQNPLLLREALNESFSFFSKRNIHDILLACTDFSGLCPNIPNMRIHDTLDILVHATVNML